jgi:hypothetical protein
MISIKLLAGLRYGSIVQPVSTANNVIVVQHDCITCQKGKVIKQDNGKVRTILVPQDKHCQLICG